LRFPSNLIYPLIAKAGKAKFRLSGTTFNVNSYSNNTVATLINGSLEITNDRDHFILKPGEQAIIKNTNDQSGLPDAIIKLSPSDTAQIVSWRKTLHFYSNMEFKDFVADIGRWYGLDIISIESVPKGYFSGSFCYDIPLEEVLEIFRRMGMHFIREGNKIIFTGNA
jgi:transmembrane sensor